VLDVGTTQRAMGTHKPRDFKTICRDDLSSLKEQSSGLLLPPPLHTHTHHTHTPYHTARTPTNSKPAASDSLRLDASPRARWPGWLSACAAD
jgi:hypothetical protein